MSHKLAELMNFMEQLRETRFTGQVRVNFHKGDISNRVEKKEGVRIRNEDREKYSTPLKFGCIKNPIFSDNER